MHFSQKPRAIMEQRVPLWLLLKLNKLFAQPETAPVARKKIQFFATEQTYQSQTLFLPRPMVDTESPPGQL